MKTRILMLIAALCFANAAALAAPTMPMHFKHLSLEDGLSQNNVQSILQDSSGYMWFATESGLNRYDGYNIHRYSRQRGNPQGFANDFVWVIAEDAEQNLWLATQGGGVVRWNRASDSFQSYRHDPNNPDSLASDDIRTLLINADGTVWVGTRNQGLDLLDPRSGHVQHFRHDPEDPASLSDNMVYALHVDSSARLWVGTDGGVNRLIGDSQSFERFENDPSDTRSLSDNRVRTIYEDRSRTLWIGTSAGGLNRFDPITKTFLHTRHDPENSASLSDDNVRVIFEDDANRFWVGTADGLNLLDRDNGTVNRYHDAPGDPQSLNDSYINSMYQDRGGLLWIGTRSAGVSRWNPRGWSLGHYEQPWLADADVASFASDGEGELWIGTLGAGLARVNENTNAIERYQHSPDDPNSISGDNVMSLLLDDEGTLWIGTMTGGLARMDTATGEIQNYRHDENDPQSIAANGVMSLYKDREGRLWVGTYGGGLSVFDKGTGTFSHFAHDPNDPTSLSDPRASAIVQDSNGSIWVGTFGGGLNLLDTASGTFRRFNNDPYDPNSLADDTVYALHIDGAGRLWVGTAGGGLDRVIEPTTDSGDIQFENLSQQDGLPSNVIYGIQSDASNQVWLSTSYGLTRYDADSSTIKTFHRGHGLQGEEFNYGAHHRAADGKLYFGGANGLNAFYPEQVEESNYSPAIVMTSFQKLNQPADTEVPLGKLTSIDLGYQDDVVNFTFAALDYTEPAQNTYSHMLQGFDDRWVDTGTVRQMTYTNLDAGQYVLKVKATTSDGVVISGVFSMPIVVAAAPWETRTAYTLYALAALAVLCLFWWLERRKFAKEAEYSRRLEKDVEQRTHQLEERNLELQVASRAKSDFLARMSHEIRTPMNGIMGLTHLLLGTDLEDKQKRFAQTIKRSAESLLDIINDILDFSKIEAGRLELEEVEFDVSELVDETVELFSGAACDKGVELICSTPPGKTVAAVGDPQRLKQVLVNLLGNAIKFTQEGEVVLRYSLLNDDTDNLTMQFEVTDTGIGIRQDNLSMIFKSFSQEDGSTSRRFGGTGLGLAICKQLVEMMNGRIGVESKPGEGSRFWFTVSMPKASPAWLSRNVSLRLANLNVLVVDSNLTSSGIVVDYLSALGVKAESVNCGYDGLKRLNMASVSSRSRFDLVLLDQDVADMTGLSMANAIGHNSEVQSAKIVLMSPAAANVAESEWREAGVDDCLAKPIRQSALYESLLMLTASTGSFFTRSARHVEETPQFQKLHGDVLLVEDNPVNQAVALGLLEEIGCDTIVAINGLDAIDHIAKRKFDVVLMDCEMPVMDGFEATAVIRSKDDETSDVPIVALTANAVDGDRERCLAAGMQDYMSKPISLETLHKTLKPWLQIKDGDTGEDDDAGAGGSETIDPASLDSIRNLKGVSGDELVKRVVDLYLSNSAMLVEDLRLAISKADAEAVRQSGHALKSSSQNVGAHGVSKLGQKFEELGRSGNLKGSGRYMQELDEIYAKTVHALRVAAQRVNAC